MDKNLQKAFNKLKRNTNLSKLQNKQNFSSKKVALSKTDEFGKLQQKLKDLDIDILANIEQINELGNQIIPLIKDLFDKYILTDSLEQEAIEVANELESLYIELNADAEELGVSIENIIDDSILFNADSLLEVYANSPDYRNLLNSNADKIIDNSY